MSQVVTRPALLLVLRRTYALLWQVAQPFWRGLVAGVALQLIGVLLGLVYPAALQQILDHGAEGADHVVPMVALIGLSFVLIRGSSELNRYVYLRTIPALHVRLQVAVIERLHALEISFHRAQRRMGLYGVSMEADELASNFIERPLRLLQLGAGVIGAIGALWLLSAPLGIGVLLMGVPFTVLATIVGCRQRTMRHQRWQSETDVSGRLWESYGAVEVIQAHAHEAANVRRIGAGLHDNAVTLGLRFYRRLLPWETLGWALELVLDIAVVAYAAAGLAGGWMQPGGAAAAILYARMVRSPLQDMANEFRDVIAGADVADRVTGVLALVPQITDKPGARSPVSPVRGVVRFEDVRYSYPTAGHRGVLLQDDSGKVEEASPGESQRRTWALDGLDLDLVRGGTTALVGRSGAGKSTAAFLLHRFADPQRGRITLDGVDLRDLKLDALRRLIALVPQFPTIFTASLLDNVRFGRPDATREQVLQALEDASALDVLEGRPGGLDAVLLEGGEDLSAGQIQRLIIARALLQDSPLLILDEATAALDAENEHAVQMSLRRLAVGRTTLVIAHRLSTVRRADRIVVLDSGRAVEQGTHSELLARGGRYARMWRLTQGDEDLEQVAAR